VDLNCGAARRETPRFEEASRLEWALVPSSSGQVRILTTMENHAISLVTMEPATYKGRNAGLPILLVDKWNNRQVGTKRAKFRHSSYAQRQSSAVLTDPNP